MQVLFATAEIAPIHRVGGLAEAASGLVKQLRADGIEVTLVIPDYDGRAMNRESVLHEHLPLATGSAALVRRGRDRELGEVLLVDTPGIARSHPYVDSRGVGWLDNDHRFLEFSAAVAALTEAARPDVVHLNDWHTALTSAFLADAPPTVLTIHTLGYQGVTGSELLGSLPHHRERYAWYDVANPLVGAIRLADAIIAVSPNYANEILTEAHGMGLHHELAARADRLVGIRNGIDVAVWDPRTDDRLAANYSPADLSGRADCRADLARAAGWDDPHEPIVGMVSRLVDQKGVDLVLNAVPFLEGLPARLVVLGSGARGLTEGLHGAAVAAPERISFTEGYDATLAHRIFAGADLFVMPSRFEPCGLAQMQAMAYGSIPVVTDVGGLHDTVVDADRDRHGGTGFVARRVDTAALVDALHRAVRAWRIPRRRQAIQRRGMSSDWSWRAPTRAHIEVYENVSSSPAP